VIGFAFPSKVDVGQRPSDSIQDLKESREHELLSKRPFSYSLSNLVTSTRVSFIMYMSELVIPSQTRWHSLLDSRVATLQITLRPIVSWRNSLPY